MNGPAWPAGYEIRVDSVLDDRWADWFGGLQGSSDGTQTVIVGLLPDLWGFRTRPLPLTWSSMRPAHTR